jgi:predicted acyl esterase
VEAILWVASPAPSADWTARFCVVDAAGRSLGLVDGIRRWHSSGAAREEIRIRVGHVSHLFARGDRLRLQIASSNFPRFDRNPQSGVAPGKAKASDFVPARQTVLGGGENQSALVLPVVTARYPRLGTLSQAV